MTETQPLQPFGPRLRALREAAGLSVAELAGRIGFTRQAVWHLEAGKGRPSWDVVQALARVLGVTTDFFRDR